MTEWIIEVNDGEEVLGRDDGLFDVIVSDTFNPFGNFAKGFFDDVGGELFDIFQRGTKVSFQYSNENSNGFEQRFVGYVVNDLAQEADGAEQVEVEAYTPTTEPGFGEEAGPITVSGSGTSVELFEDIAITRTVGRPNSAIRGTTRDYPNYTDQRKTAYDAFDIGFQLVQNGPAKVVDIARDILGAPLGRDSLTLDFQGLFGMGAFNDIPDGSQAFRYQRIAGQKDVENAPTLSLRRVI